MLFIFIISTSVHLFASAKKNRKWRNYTKPFILASLAGYYCCTTEKIRLVVILALLFSWIGDLFLMIKGTKWFVIGGISFMVSHFFFVLCYYPDVVFANINIILLIAISLFFICIVSIIFSKLKLLLPNKLFKPMFLYLLINGTMNCFAILRMLSLNSPSHLITVIGAVLFFISDSSLFFVRFSKSDKEQNHFLVMLTYSLGELLIVLGLI